MGRRALPKIDPVIDYSAAFLDVKKLPASLDVDAIFGRSAPLEVEMGSGKGLFLQSAAARFPERNFLGVELADKYARFTAARLTRKQLTNARIASGDGLRLFAECLRDASVSAVHVYFPDPWWKARHRKRRVMRESFVKDIERVLMPGGKLHFWSDVKEYFDVSVELLAAATKLAGPFQVDESPAEHDLDYRTHFERRMRMNNEPVYRSEYRKSAS